MNPIELMADSCARNLEMLKGTVGDFSDADMLVRPCSGANHAAWQIGHLIASEANMINACKPGALPELPAGFAAKFTSQTSRLDDAGAFPSKADLLKQYEKTRAATVQWVKSLTPEALNQPGPEPLRGMAPTTGHLVLLVLQHLAMHIGQIQAIRRKLGKPVLF
jgi:hypothetical protein